VRIFPDTNVLVSAFLSTGTCYELLHRIIKAPEHDLLIGAFILEETRRKLREKIRAPEELIREFERALISSGENPPTPQILAPVPVRDVDDVWVLASAVSAQVDVLVTGDGDLLELAGRVQGLQILRPRELLNLL
jgi:putative PIN family toxin of toxin-antitoxin system